MLPARQRQAIAVEIARAITINSPHEKERVARSGSESLFDVVTLILMKVFNLCMKLRIVMNVDDKLILLRASQICGLKEFSCSVLNKTLQAACGLTVARTATKHF